MAVVNDFRVAYDGKCRFAGVILRAGAADTVVRIFDQKNGAPNPTQERPGTRAPIFDGFGNIPIYMENGITIQIDQIDAVAWVLYDPL